MEVAPIRSEGVAGSVPTASERYIRELDGIRTIAVSLTVAAHYQLIPYVPGGFGVTLFFFLSGYLITTLFYSEYHATSGIDIPRFYLRRWLRLTPPLVMFVVFGVIFYRESCNSVGGLPVPIGTTMAAIFYYTNYYDLLSVMAPALVIPFGICWSLAIEEHFYLAWPWILRRSIQHTRRLFIVIGCVCGGVLIWRLIAHDILMLSTDYTYMATDCRIDSIFYGVLLRVLFETPWAATALRILRAPMCRILASLALLMTFLIRDEGFRQTFRYSIQGIALMPFFTAVLTEDPKGLFRRALASPPMVLIGRLSYSIYLFHLPARTPAEVYFGSPYRVESVMFGLLFTLAAAYAVYVFVERPIAVIRRRFRAKGGAAHSAAPVAPLTAAPGAILREEELS
jgi:peptidoglycan/LPS O-acetylase OafA/YrhL